MLYTRDDPLYFREYLLYRRNHPFNSHNSIIKFLWITPQILVTTRYITETYSLNHMSRTRNLQNDCVSNINLKCAKVFHIEKH